MRDVYWASCALMWIVTVFAVIAGWKWRKPLKTATAEMQALLLTRREDADLATWCRKTHLTVVAVTGTEVTLSLEELYRSDHPSRSWNVPVSVAVWSTLADTRPPVADSARG